MKAALVLLVGVLATVTGLLWLSWIAVIGHGVGSALTPLPSWSRGFDPRSPLRLVSQVLLKVCRWPSSSGPKPRTLLDGRRVGGSLRRFASDVEGCGLPCSLGYRILCRSLRRCDVSFLEMSEATRLLGHGNLLIRGGRKGR